MEIKKKARIAMKALALICFIGSAYVYTYVQVGFKGPKPAVLLQLAAVLAILMGAFVLIDGLLAPRDENAPWKKRVLIVVGLVIALAAAAWYFLGIPAA